MRLENLKSKIDNVWRQYLIKRDIQMCMIWECIGRFICNGTQNEPVIFYTVCN